MLSDLKRRNLARERLTSQLADSSVLPKSIWGRTLNERPAASGRLKQRARRGILPGYENLLVRGLGLPVDIVRHIVEALRKRIMDGWIAKRSEHRFVMFGNPSTWGHRLWSNMVRDGRSHLITPRRVYRREGGLDGGPYWFQSSTPDIVQGPWGLINPSTTVIHPVAW